MNCRYDLIVIDLDGTLLDRRGRVSMSNLRAIDRAREVGVDIIIATGRALSESLDAVEAITHEGLFVAASGSLLCDVASGRTIDRRVLDYELVHHVTDTLVEHGHKVLVLKDAHAAGYDYLAVGDGEMDPASQWWFSTLRATLRHVDDLGEDDHPHDTVRTGVVAQGDELEPIASELKADIGDRAFLQHWSAVTETEVTGSRTHLLEVFHPGVNKWTMIEAHCEREGIDPQRIAAIGDGLNDIELVANAGLGVAMANADARVRAAAAHITADHDEDGVAAAIGRMLEGQW